MDYHHNSESIRHVTTLRSISTLLESLRRLAHPPEVAWARHPERNSRETLAAVLIGAILDPALPMPVLLACAAALKHSLYADSTESALSLADRAQTLVLETLAKPNPKDSRIVAALAMLESAARDHKRLKGRDIATLEAVSQSRLSGLIHAATGFCFTEWRSAYLLRHSLIPLADTKEHVKQIACRLLGFSHQSHFNHKFKMLFGLSPTEFRQRCQSVRTHPYAQFVKDWQRSSRIRRL